MTSVLNVDTIAAKDGTSAATLTKQEASKSWVRFNGGSNAINDSFNHSSFVDNGTGNYALHYTNSFGNELYCGQGTSKEVADTSAVNNNGTGAMLHSYETGRIQFLSYSPDGNTRDGQTSNLTIHGDLA
jgi:hypothetical protein